MATPTKRFLYTPVRVEMHLRDGGVSTGTSFVFRDTTAPAAHQLFLVSNKHVIQDAETAYFFFTPKDSNGNPQLGEPFFLKSDMFSGQWHGHPNEDVDIAVMPLSWQLDMLERGGQTAHLNPVTTDDVAGENLLENLDISSPVLFVGFPNGMFDEKHYLPIFRRGYVATSPELDFNSDPVFLIDASVFPGSSGSPVFTVGDDLIGGTPPWKFLGVIAAVYTQPADGRITWQPTPTTQVPIPTIDQMIDLGVVFKARCVTETIASFWEEHASKIAGK